MMCAAVALSELRPQKRYQLPNSRQRSTVIYQEKDCIGQIEIYEYLHIALMSINPVNQSFDSHPFYRKETLPLEKKIIIIDISHKGTTKQEALRTKQNGGTRTFWDPLSTKSTNPLERSGHRWCGVITY